MDSWYTVYKYWFAMSSTATADSAGGRHMVIRGILPAAYAALFKGPDQ